LTYVASKNASFIIGKIPSVQIGYVLSPYILLPAFITLLFVTKAICLCCKISMIDYLITFFSLPISHFSIILNFTCCCTELGGRIPSSESNQGRNAITVIRFATSNNQINSVQERNITHSNAGEYSIPFFKKGKKISIKYDTNKERIEFKMKKNVHIMGGIKLNQCDDNNNKIMTPCVVFCQPGDQVIFYDFYCNDGNININEEDEDDE